MNGRRRMSFGQGIHTLRKAHLSSIWANSDKKTLTVMRHKIYVICKGNV